MKGELFAVLYYCYISEYINIKTKYRVKKYIVTNITLTSTDDRFDQNCRGGYDIDLAPCCTNGNCREGEGRTKPITFNILSYSFYTFINSKIFILFFFIKFYFPTKR